MDLFHVQKLKARWRLNGFSKAFGHHSPENGTNDRQFFYVQLHSRFVKFGATLNFGNNTTLMVEF